MAINLKTWGPLGIAIVLGGFAAKAGYDVMSRRQPEKVVVQKVTRVAVAKDDLAAGTSIGVDDVTMNNVPEASAPSGTFDNADRLSKRVTTVPVKKGQPIFETMLAPIGSGDGLTAIVPAGKRAVTMEINEYSGVAGLIVPGCRVDVVATFPDDNGKMMTKTICRSLRIMAVGRRYSEAKNSAGQQSQGGAEEPPMSHSVTLEVTAREAEIIDLAAHTGAPRLVLRSSRDGQDSKDEMSEGVTVAELRGNKPVGTPNANPLANFFTNLVNQIAQKGTQVADDRKLSDPAGLFGQPATQPTRQVTIIRNTREQSVQVNVDPKQQPQQQTKGSTFVNTDTNDAVQK